MVVVERAREDREDKSISHGDATEVKQDGTLVVLNESGETVSVFSKEVWRSAHVEPESTSE